MPLRPEGCCRITSSLSVGDKCNFALTLSRYRLYDRGRHLARMRSNPRHGWTSRFADRLHAVLRHLLGCVVLS